MPRRSPFALRSAAVRASTLTALQRRSPPSGLDGVLAALDRTATACPVPGQAAGDGFTWDEHDRTDRSWWPQGVATTRNGSVLLVSWYARRRARVWTEGSRVSVVDMADPAAPRYRHVRLVMPRRPLGLLHLSRVPVHVGGLAVLGDLLYVADTRAGLRVFRLSDLTRRPDGEHVLPQLLRLRVPLLAGRQRLKWSFVSVGDLDGQLSLVAGEYGRKGSTPRLVRFLLDPSTGLPSPGTDGRSTPLEVHERQPVRMQGVAVHGSTWWLSASAGEGNPGDLHVGRPGAWQRHRAVLPPGPEDLDWSAPGERLWGVTEWPGSRWVFPVDVDRLP